MVDLLFEAAKVAAQEKQLMEFSLKLESNPNFTSSVLVAYARAAYRLGQTGQSGAKTAFDIPFGLLITKITPNNFVQNYYKIQTGISFRRVPVF